MESKDLSSELKKIIVSEEEIRGIISRIAGEIEKDYKGKKLLICGILKGCFIFTADLVREIDLPLEISFVKAESYGSEKESAGQINFTELTDFSKYKGYEVIIVDDILDTGNTLSYLEKYLKEKGFANVSICVLLDKPERRQSGVCAKYTGKIIANEFVVGYGLDYDEKFRNLPYIAVVK